MRKTLKAEHFQGLDKNQYNSYSAVRFIKRIKEAVTF
ncbi:hypothetical protein FB480_1092 [Agrobacterium vitis]|nr:hypothetical protein FB480_1092 [Agrobacterium vitis]